ncbi:NAD(P)-dependent glycerol-3-phosphate dehydrogenase [Spirochaetales bacterium BR151]|uniref:Glycerol-3-phosphate dehydrogenase [NAD(P)+] n=2 Tax=Entomospira culicis TaxID=2719989 RepID=A0A968GI92_9SPIO|nr:NAD(P)-dependent glycerol-3-phosphate dehydrogenase [Entomospira culicis]NIZ69464.1 NAD(P)-dependent glycerol-3-phosphate dehydrogenase [Entomospira culicis]
MRSIAVVGAGAFGTALAKVLAEKGVDVKIWAFKPETAEDINTHHRNQEFLPDAILPTSLTASSDLTEVVQDRDVVLLVTPSNVLIQTARQLLSIPCIAEGKAIIACATKGLIRLPSGDGQLLLDGLENYLPGFYKGNMVYISGPSHAEEIAQGKVTALVAASQNPMNAIIVRELFTAPTLRVFSSIDVSGVQVVAALKNVVALAFGAIEAYAEKSNNIGDNTESFLLSAGLNEMMILARAMGSTHFETITGPAGIGDLDVTCRSKYGRNRRFGRSIYEQNLLNDFADLDDLMANVTTKVGYLPEGVFAARTAYLTAQKYNLRTPMFTAIYRVLNKELDVESAVQELIYGV